MRHVEMLIPEEERRAGRLIRDEQFDFTLELGADADALRAVAVAHPEGLGRFFHTPIILDVMARNMHLPVQALQRVGGHSPRPSSTQRWAWPSPF